MEFSYVLSWEEFLEVHQEALPKPHWSSLVAMILMAIATGAFGALLVYFIDSRDRLVASTSCWLSFGISKSEGGNAPSESCRNCARRMTDITVANKCSPLTATDGRIERR